MRWSVSESWSFGPLKVTASKSGLSASLGIPGFRVGLNTKGQARVAVGKNGFGFRKSKKILPDMTKLILNPND